jgi:AcrR family transcriptional regulator
VALLDAAERLFSENGVEGTSVRDIIKAADVNLGAINYHFGTKDRLALEVFARRIQPVNRARIARLDALEKAVSPDKITLPQILEALIRPVMEGDGHDVKSCENLMRLISRSFQEPNPEVKKFVEEQFAEVVRRFDSAILRVIPDLPQGELFWRMCFLHGALHQGLAKWLLFDQLPNVVLNPAAAKPSREGLIQSLITFMAAGLSAPVPRPPEAPSAL